MPKFLPVEGPDGWGSGERNGVRCAGIEHKMGIRASSTCTMQFEGAVGWLVGAPHQGMAAMFTMMNAARLAVGIQGLAAAEAAYQEARAYALERLQGRSPAGPHAPDRAADPIIVHPDVRRNLLTIKAFIEGARALAYWVGLQLDRAERHPDPAERQAADDLAALMTPIIKAFLTDHGFAATNLAMQVFGGHGYIRETGVEQYVRDARIAQIYEGANGIQALDLVGRKLGQHTGRLLRRFFHPVAACLEEAAHDPGLADLALPLAKAFGQAAAGHRPDRPARAGRPRGGRRRRDRLPAALRLRGAGLHVAAHGEAGAGPPACRRWRRRLLRGQGEHGTVLHAARYCRWPMRTTWR